MTLQWWGTGLFFLGAVLAGRGKRCLLSAPACWVKGGSSLAVG
jgi:hypothetical protein